jgi:ribokinase
MSLRPVVVLGSINVDVVVTVPRLPGPGETVSDGVLARCGGGKGANQAVAVARAGVPVRLVSAVGDDEAGREAIAELDGEGVDCRTVARLGGVATGTALIVVDRAGENQIAVAPGANHALETVPDGLFAGPPGILAISFEAPDSVIDGAARQAADAGWEIFANPAPARTIPPALAACAPVLTPNEHEAAYLTGEADPVRAADALRRSYGGPVVITLGAAGVLLHDGTGDPVALPAPRVEAVDTTGAGDVFCGTLAAGRARGLDLRTAAEEAVAAASHSTLLRGARGRA